MSYDADVQRLTYTFDEVCIALGVNEHIVRGWMNRADHPLPHVRTERKLVFPKGPVSDWISDEARRQTERPEPRTVTSPEIARRLRKV